MQASIKRSRQSAPGRRFVWVALLVICALLTHSLDNCAAHTGLPSSCSADVPLLGAPCSDADGVCNICRPGDEPHSDGCDSLSELAVRTSSQHPIEYRAVNVSATIAVIPTMPLIALSGCLHNRAGPSPALPTSVFLRSSLPCRAPPLSA